MVKYYYDNKKFSILIILLFFTKLVWGDSKEQVLLLEARSEGFYIFNSVF